MNIARLSWSYLAAKPLSTFLNIVLFTLGIAIIVVLVLFNRQLEDQLTKNSKGIDLVVGAKGSPMQIILSNIFHIDFPTGNINLFEAEQLASNYQIKEAVPLALGDSYKGYRIVGTTEEFNLYSDLEIAEGQLWSEDLEVTLGSEVAASLGLVIGEEFASQHGLSELGGAHDENHYTVSGILEPSGSVVDNLILTSVQSVWMVHEDHSEDEVSNEDHIDNHTDNQDTTAMKSTLIPGLILHDHDSALEVTSLLIQYRSPMGAVMLPRMINQNTNMQAASPAFETARLFSLVGVGVDVIRGFAFIIIFIAALSIFIALFNSLKERKYDLAIMRSMGATKTKLFLSIILEGIIITLAGCLLGFVVGHLTIEIVSTVMASGKTGISGLIFFPEEMVIFLVSLGIGLIAALIPAAQVFRTDISRILARG